LKGFINRLIEEGRLKNINNMSLQINKNLGRSPKALRDNP